MSKQPSKIASVIELIKPRLTAMALFSGAVGYVAGTDPDQDFNWMRLIHIVIGLGFVGAASNITNQAMEVELDAQMERTKDRPIVTGRVSKREAYIIGLISLVIGIVYLNATIHSFIMYLSLATYLSYIVVYTPMKTKSAFNTIIGAIPGALPIFTGWVAARNIANDGSIIHGDYTSIFIFAFLFVWQLPHFFSIAWIYKDDYKNAGYKMISYYDDSGKPTIILIFVTNLAMMIISYSPLYFMGDKQGILYAILLTAGNVACFIISIMLMVNRERFMKWYFYASIIYLPYVLILLMIFRSTPELILNGQPVSPH